MLIHNDIKFIKTPFKNEEELEKVVFENYEFLFGPSSIFLPKKMIKTGDGSGTIPDGFAIDLEGRKWSIIEAELLHHTVWKHIAPQVSKQAIASIQPLSRRNIEDMAVDQYQTDATTKEKFDEQGIKEINIRKVLSEILNTTPQVGIPIDDISDDLKEWAKTLKYKVKLWKISKYVEFNHPENIIYEFPEEFTPTLDTEEDENNDEGCNKISRYDVKISDLIESGYLKVGEILIMEYKPRNGTKRIFEGVIEEEGAITVLGQTYNSLSYAAYAGMKAAGSNRNTINGWTSWKSKGGKYLSEIRECFLKDHIKKDDV